MKLKRGILFLCWPGLLSLILLMAHCAPDSQNDRRPPCNVRGLEAGSFSFSLDEVEDGCLGGLLEEIIPLGRYASVLLPDFADLPVETNMQLPLVGWATVLLSAEGDIIRISMPEDFEGVVEIEDCLLVFRARGTLCPVTNDQAEVAVTFTLTDVEEGESELCNSLQPGCRIEAASQCSRCP